MSSSSEKAFYEFLRKGEDVVFQGTLRGSILAVLLGDFDTRPKPNVSFNDLDQIPDVFTIKTQPAFCDSDLLYGMQNRIRQDLGRYIIPSLNRQALAVSNFFTEVEGSADVAKRQACYNGAVGARGMHRLQSYRSGGLQFDNNAYAISSSYHIGTGVLEIYATHLTQSATPNAPEYHTTLLDSFDLTDTTDTFRQGVNALRNARDWAREKRYAFLSAVHQRVTQEAVFHTSVAPSLQCATQ